MALLLVNWGSFLFVSLPGSVFPPDPSFVVGEILGTV